MGSRAVRKTLNNYQHAVAAQTRNAQSLDVTGSILLYIVLSLYVCIYIYYYILYMTAHYYIPL